MPERYQLVRTPERLELRDTQDPKVGSVYVDFLEGKARHRRQFGGGKGQDIAKAIGLHKFKHAHVVDATAGLGRESFVLAALGCTVTMLERSPIVHALVDDALRRALASADSEVVDIVRRMTLHLADARTWLKQFKHDPGADVVYCDPMFPERNKSALVQKEMRFFHAIVGADEDSGSLLELACNCARYRVVVKRPRHAPELAGCKPAFVIGGKTVRYDVYLGKATAQEYTQQ
ncbi:class I SAM-dependent methyltransferase [Candidatus Thiothrix sp. Deng01]|uniref:Ribosomal RNA small subunit methyltransferase J n=1 Tax=Candidatus Thiothrix phosphatis TaxID=3112415 RepID=A0ABU6CYA1_9GAMM|nr:class I SAM-dependent methyltransferase [Candidatus Thiothrix sp. Deng01]MEB4591810.1 class I SAM-dependent methyltransferase [Candidatus Thiothrix sp. Deng01]